jgi:hypothetical protein
MGKTFRLGMDIQRLIEKMQVFVIPLPDDPPEDSFRTEIRIWEKRIDNYVNQDIILLSAAETNCWNAVLFHNVSSKHYLFSPSSRCSRSSVMST